MSHLPSLIPVLPSPSPPLASGASRIGYGKSAKLILQSDATASSLKERQEVFNEKMKMKRNKLNPRSVSLVWCGGALDGWALDGWALNGWELAPSRHSLPC